MFSLLVFIRLTYTVALGYRALSLVAMNIAQELQAIVGRDHLSTSLPLRRSYSRDASESPPRIPDAIVFPAQVEEVTRLLKVANKRHVPLTPSVARTNGWGLHIPLKGGIVVDLSRMNRIVEINREMRYMVVEPGVTIDEAFAAAQRHNMWLSIPKSCPADASMLVNLLIDGVGFMLLKFGTQSQLINGLEAVLPGGDLLRCGSCAFGPYWFSRAPLPDLVGLFTGWYGSTGIVTKIGFPIYAKPRHLGVVCFGVSGPVGDDFSGLLSTLVDLDVADDITAFTPNAGKFVGEDVKRGAPGVQLFVYTIVTGPSKRMVEIKEKELARAVQGKPLGGRTLRRLTLSKRDRENYLSLPSPRKGFQRESFAGATNPCAFLPLAKWPEVMKQIEIAFRRTGKRPEFRLGVLRGSHCGPLMTYIRFDRRDQSEKKAIRRLTRQVVQVYVANGGLVWKAPPWAWKMQTAGGKGHFEKTLNKIKRALDPNDIMAPGRLITSMRS